jgi:hypothetical protein
LSHAGAIDMGSFGLIPWHFVRQIEAETGRFLSVASECEAAERI